MLSLSPLTVESDYYSVPNFEDIETWRQDLPAAIIPKTDSLTPGIRTMDATKGAANMISSTPGFSALDPVHYVTYGVYSSPSDFDGRQGLIAPSSTSQAQISEARSISSNETISTGVIAGLRASDGFQSSLISHWPHTGSAQPMNAHYFSDLDQCSAESQVNLAPSSHHHGLNQHQWQDQRAVAPDCADDGSAYQVFNPDMYPTSDRSNSFAFPYAQSPTYSTAHSAYSQINAVQNVPAPSDSLQSSQDDRSHFESTYKSLKGGARSTTRRRRATTVEAKTKRRASGTSRFASPAVLSANMCLPTGSHKSSTQSNATFAEIIEEEISSSSNNIGEVLTNEEIKQGRISELYARDRSVDGLYHCAFEDEGRCNHRPTKLKCNYEYVSCL